MKTQKHPILPQLPTDDVTRKQFDKGVQEVLSDLHRNVRRDLDRMAFTGGKRQTVLSCAMDSTDLRKSKFLTATSSTVSIDATTAPLVLSFADGADDAGAVDHVERLTHDVSGAWSGGFTRRVPQYLYATRDRSGNLSYGKTIIQPRYLADFERNPKHVLLHFDGTNDSTTITDEWGGTWTAINNAKLKTGISGAWGTACLYLDGTGDQVTSGTTYAANGVAFAIAGPRFTIEGRFQDLGHTVARILFRLGLTSDYSMQLAINTDGKLGLYVSTNGSTWNIASNLKESNAWSLSTWYHIALEMQWLEEAGTYRYVVYRDGTAVITTSTADTVGFGNSGYGTTLLQIGGGQATSCWYGYIDEVRVTIGANRYGKAFTAPSAPFNKYDGDIHWFNLSTFKMNVLTSSGWEENQRLFLGATYQKDDADEIDSVRSFQPLGYYQDMELNVAVVARYIDWGLGMCPDDGVQMFGGYLPLGRPSLPTFPLGHDSSGYAWARWDSFRGLYNGTSLYPVAGMPLFARTW